MMISLRIFDATLTQMMQTEQKEEKKRGAQKEEGRKKREQTSNAMGTPSALSLEPKKKNQKQPSEIKEKERSIKAEFDKEKNRY